MSTITSLVGTDGITTANSMAKINTNFSNLNTDKIETSALDTDTSLAANSDSKIATQRATKAYVDALGNVNASTSARGIVEEATAAEIAAGTGAGATSARLFINPTTTAGTSAGAADEGKIPRLNSSGVIDKSMISVATSGTATHDISSTTSNTIAHGLGKIPTLIRVTATFQSATGISWAMTTYSGGSQKSVKWFMEFGTSTNAVEGNDFTIYSTPSAFLTGTVTIDATNITIAWAKTGSPTGTFNMVWEAYA